MQNNSPFLTSEFCTTKIAGELVELHEFSFKLPRPDLLKNLLLLWLLPLNLESFGHVSLSELCDSVSDAASFMKQICKFLPNVKTQQKKIKETFLLKLLSHDFSNVCQTNRFVILFVDWAFAWDEKQDDL